MKEYQNIESRMSISKNGYKKAVIDAEGLYYRELNTLIRGAIQDGIRKFEINGVTGQRYIGTNVYDCPDLGDVEIKINGVPGSDLGAFLNGPKIVVNGNAQDGCGNTMNAGEIVVHGGTGDIAGFSARGGRLMIRDNAGCRVGIHMKEYGERKPVLVIGGTTQDFLGEYMAGGVIIVLGLGLEGPHPAAFIGTGMHGGAIFIRGDFDRNRLGREVGEAEPDEEDLAIIKEQISTFSQTFDIPEDKILSKSFTKLYPKYLRPYGKLYAY